MIFTQILEAKIIFKMAAMTVILDFPKSKHVLQLGQRICTPNLVLISAAVWHILMKQKCDGWTDGRKEGLFLAGGNYEDLKGFIANYYKHVLESRKRTGRNTEEYKRTEVAMKHQHQQH